MKTETSTPDRSCRFSEQRDLSRHSLLGEFIDFLKDNKKWWLLPIVAALVLVGALMFAGGGAAAPFIYTLF